MIRDDEVLLFNLVNSMYIDGQKDATLTISEINEKCYRSTVIEEQYIIVGEPGEF